MILNWAFLIVGIFGLCTTGALAILKKKTLSERAQGLLPMWADWIVGIAGMIGLCLLYSFAGLDGNLCIVWSGFWGHIWISNKERWKKS